MKALFATPISGLARRAGGALRAGPRFLLDRGRAGNPSASGLTADFGHGLHPVSVDRGAAVLAFLSLDGFRGVDRETARLMLPGNSPFANGGFVSVRRLRIG